MVGIFRYDLEKNTIFEANERTWEILGKQAAEQPIFGNILSIRDGIRIRNKLKRKGFIDSYELYLLTDENDKIWLSLSGRSFQDQGFFEGVIKDVTEEKESFLELKRVNFELDNFVYHTSHDLRSPLLSIQGLVDICRNEDSLENIQRYLELMEKSAKRLDSLVINLLTLSRNTRADTQIQKVDFETQVNETVEVLNLNKPSNLQVILDIEQDTEFHSDTTRLSIILNNLISNAFKYQNPSEANPRVKVSVATTDEKAVIEVEDNGMGIPKENQARIFEMFYRATDQSHGSGLGLFIVKNVVDKLAGKINFQSTVRRGTKFTVILPNMVSKAAQS